jgi:hypothetical protein
VSIRPIFVLSLPRSGSTLVQRVLAAHEGVSTAPEPWIVLPQVYALRGRGVYAEYGHALAARALRDFAGRLPEGEATYWAAIRGAIERLYAAAAAPGDRFFVDKTPRYHFVVDELFALFPEAAFIFLWRNPLAVVASTVETWGRGRWMVERWRVDLFDGLDRLVRARERYADRAHSVRFEDLVARPEASWPPLFAAMGIDFDPRSLERFAEVDVEARMGDPTGRRRYATLATEPLDRWKATIHSPLRRRWCREYLRWIGAERLATMGYRLEDLLRELEDVPVRIRPLGSDVARTAYARALRWGRSAAGGLLWNASKGGQAGSRYERSNGQTSSP